MHPAVAQTVMEKTTGGPRIGDHLEKWFSVILAEMVMGHAIQSLAALRNDLALTAPTSFHLTGCGSLSACHDVQLRSGASQISHRVVQFYPSESRAVIEPQAMNMAPTTQQIVPLWPITVVPSPASSPAGMAAFHSERRDQRFCPMASCRGKLDNGAIHQAV